MRLQFDLRGGQEYNLYTHEICFAKGINVDQIRPINLNLFTIKQPLPAIVSILHRITGLCLFFLIPVFIWAFQISLTESGFAQIQTWMHDYHLNLLIWLLLIPFLYHLIAGIRHLISDIGIANSLRGGRLSAKLVLLISIIMVILAGVWLW